MNSSKPTLFTSAYARPQQAVTHAAEHALACHTGTDAYLHVNNTSTGYALKSLSYLSRVLLSSNPQRSRSPQSNRSRSLSCSHSFSLTSHPSYPSGQCTQHATDRAPRAGTLCCVEEGHHSPTPSSHLATCQYPLHCIQLFQDTAG